MNIHNRYCMNIVAVIVTNKFAQLNTKIPTLLKAIKQNNDRITRNIFIQHKLHNKYVYLLYLLLIYLLGNSHDIVSCMLY